jgi:hypothetical protein
MKYTLSLCLLPNKIVIFYFSNKPAPTVGAQLPLPTSIRHNEQDKPNLKRKIHEAIDGGKN